MKVFVCILAIVAFAQAEIDWANIQSKNIYVPVKGLPSFHKNNRIIGGMEAGPNQFPYQAALFIDNSHFCGGSLISKNYVLTAAHCAYGARNIEVILGAHNVYKQEPNQVRMTSGNIQVHEAWNSQAIMNDVAVIKLPQPAPLSASIQIVKLPSKSDESNSFAGVMSTISGWGKNSDNAGGITPDLQYINIPIITNNECKQYFGSYIQTSNICASGAGHKSTCNGDSGGPLVVNKNGAVTQVGVTSFVSGAGCEASYPHAYARVTSFLAWIESHTDVVISP